MIRKITASCLIAVSFIATGIIQSRAAEPVALTREEASEWSAALADVFCKGAKQMINPFGFSQMNSNSYDYVSSALNLVDAWKIRNYESLILSEQTYGYSSEQLILEPMRADIRRNCY